MCDLQRLITTVQIGSRTDHPFCDSTWPARRCLIALQRSTAAYAGKVSDGFCAQSLLRQSCVGGINKSLIGSATGQILRSGGTARQSSPLQACPKTPAPLWSTVRLLLWYEHCRHEDMPPGMIKSVACHVTHCDVRRQPARGRRPDPPQRRCPGAC